MIRVHQKVWNPRTRRTRERFLDVRLQADVHRRRRWGWVVRLVVFVLLVAGAVVGARPVRTLVLDRWMYRTPAFALRDFEVTTDGILSRQEIENTARVSRGQNVLALDLPLLSERLLAHPRIRSAAIERRLPGRLSIAVRERVPVARIGVLRLNDLNVTYLLDEEGRAMLPLGPGWADPQVVEEERLLPLITCPERLQVAPGGEVLHPGVRTALQWIAGFEGSPMAAVTEIVHVDLRTPGVLLLTTSQGSLISVRPGSIESQIEDWQRIWNLGAPENRMILTLDLTVGRNIPVRWHEAPAADPGTPERRPLRSKRTRKNHV